MNCASSAVRNRSAAMIDDFFAVSVGVPNAPGDPVALPPNLQTPGEATPRSGSVLVGSELRQFAMSGFENVSSVTGE